MKSNFFLVILILFFSSDVFAKNKRRWVNLRYNSPQGAILELRTFAKLGLGFSFTNETVQDSMNTTSITSDVLAKVQHAGVRLTWYKKGFGEASAYFSLPVGKVTGDISRIYTLPTSATFTGKVDAHYFGLFVGYHWFIRAFNFHVGGGGIAWSKRDFEITSGASIETLHYIPRTVYGLEWGLGLAF